MKTPTKHPHLHLSNSKHPIRKGFYQIAFGHHRIESLKELGYDEISIKVLRYTDAQMLRAMAEENREIGQHDLKIMTQTVEQVKKYLDGELGKYNTWKEFRTLKVSGVGKDTILKFLGITWKVTEISFALEVY